jgi:cytochrome c oxidase cbb3-type subunit 1
MIYFMVPRLTGRDWVFPRLINMHFFFTVYGVGAITVGALIGGYIHGSAAEAWLQPWGFVVDAVRPYAAVATFAWCMILFANVFFFFHLLVMWLGLSPAVSGDTQEEPAAPAAAPTH